jgi:predicted RNase H-like nuclease
VTAVLGIDAAWTPHNSSGIALVSNRTGRWRCEALAPSYRSFVALADGAALDWNGPMDGDHGPTPPALLDTARRLLGGATVDLVAVDMPISRAAIVGRRPADDAISRAYGAAGCSTHSPSGSRPGQVGVDLTKDFVDLGYPLAVAGPSPPTRALIEVYPHPALLRLTGSAFRLPYKIGKAGRTWANVRPMWERILGELAKHIDNITLELPEDVRSKATLKGWEDAIDALVCAWVGIEYVEGRARAFGDGTAAIWCPV